MTLQNYCDCHTPATQPARTTPNDQQFVLHIEKLVLDGLPLSPAQSELLRQELQQILTQRWTPTSINVLAAKPDFPLTLQLQPALGITAMAQKIADVLIG
jgi:hypothetical protein